MSRRPNSGKKNNLSQFGLIDIPDLNDDDEQLDLSDDDLDLEAELAAITGGGVQKQKPKKPPPVPVANLDVMIAESLKDIPSDEEASGDDDDPELLNELKALAIDDDEEPAPPPRTSRPAPPPPGGEAPLSTDSSTISLIQDRITNYTVAEKIAKTNGESSRARRFGRGLKTLGDLLKQAKAGKTIKNEDIPPPVMVGKADGGPKPSAPILEDLPPSPPVEVVLPPPNEPMIDFDFADENPPEPASPQKSFHEPPSPKSSSEAAPPEPSPPDTGNDERKKELQIILTRKAEFKAAALAAKKRGDKYLALGLLKVTKQFDTVVEAHNNGEIMNMDELPTVDMITRSLEQERLQQDGTQTSAAPTVEPSTTSSVLIVASSLGEGLRQRMEAFKKSEEKAKEEGNASKARRMNRIVKQYADAIKLNDAGKSVSVDELPTPAGYGPLPSPSASTGTEATSTTSVSEPAEPQSSHISGRSARNENVLALLIKRQTQFKEAALYHKKKGEIDTAIQLLRNAKRFDPLIEATRNGQPVDLSKLPVPPLAITGNRFTSKHSQQGSSVKDPIDTPVSLNPSDEISGPSTDWVEIPAVPGGSASEDVFACLLQQLENQAKLSSEYMKRCKKMGHVAEAKMYEKLNERVREDLDILRVAMLNNRGLPNFHYVMREFSIAQCNTDLGVNDLELTIIRGIAYNMPKGLDTYVRFEFPFPQDAPVSDRTEIVKSSNNPEYNAVFPLIINRSRACQRVFKRHGIKLEVWNRGGWFRSDVLIGTVVVKLAPLQEEVTLHDSFPLYEGRKQVGGSLEVKLRVRTPLLQQEIRTTKHRWLILDDVEMF